MRWVIWISLLWMGWVAKGQPAVYPLIDPSMVWIAGEDTAKSWQTGAFSWLEAGSGTVPSALVNRFLQAGSIDNELKQTALDRLQANNSAGLQWRQGAFVQHLVDGQGWWLRLENSTTLGINFSRDLFQLAMFGNASFAGTTASLDGQLVQDNHNLLEVGRLKSWSLGGHTVTAAPFVALKQGYSAQSGELSGTIFTAADGSYLDLDASGYWFRTDSAYVTPTTFRGFGANAGLWLQLKAGSWLVGGRYHLQLPVNWSAFSPNFSGSVQRRWTGWDITELFNGNGNDPLGIDSLASYLDTLKTAPTFQAQHQGTLFITRQMGNWDVTLGANLTTESWKRQQVYAQVSRQLGAKPLALAGHVAYGGWSGYNMGMHLRGELFPGLYLMAGTQHLLSLALPMDVSGTSYFVLLAWQW